MAKTLSSPISLIQLVGVPNGHATVTILKQDGSGNALLAVCTTVPNALAGYAKGCRLIKTDAAAGIQGEYINIGTTASCNFSQSLSGTVTNAQMGADNVKEVSLALTNAQIKALKATPITIVAAPGVGSVIVPIDCQVYLLYGTSAFTANASDNNVTIKRVGGSTLLTGCAQAFVQATSSGVCKLVPGSASIADTKLLSDNIALQVANAGAAEIAGNAGNDNTMIVKLTYRVDSLTW